MSLGPRISTPELNALLKRAVEEVARMSPEERASMFASQAIGYAMSELVMSVHEDGEPAYAVKMQLQHMLDALNGDANVYLSMSVVVERVWRLLPHDRESLRVRIQNALSELDA